MRFFFIAFALPSLVAAVRIVAWVPPGTDSAVLDGSLAAVFTGTGASAAESLTDPAALCAALLGEAGWLVVPSFVSLPLGRYWGVGDDTALRGEHEHAAGEARSAGQQAESQLAAAAAPCSVAQELSSWFARGGRWLIAPGAHPSGWFMDVPLPLMALNVFTPEYGLLSEVTVPLPDGTALARVAVTSALTFPSVGEADFGPGLSALDARNRTLAWASSHTRFRGGAFAGGCWVLQGLLSSDGFADVAWRSAIAAHVAACDEPLPPPPPPYTSCPCPARGSPAAPLLPRLSLSSDGRHFAFPNGTLWLTIGADIFRDTFVGLSLVTVASLFDTAAAAGANAARLYGWLPGSAVFSCALDCATLHHMYILHTIDGHLTDWSNGDALSAHAVAVGAAVANETVVYALDCVNEPYTSDIAALRVNATSNETLGAQWNVSMTVYKEFEAALTPGAFSTFPNVTHGIPALPGFNAFARALDGMWGEWLALYTAPLAAAAPLTHVCVGSNHWEGLLDSVQRGTTFWCSHAYADSGLGYANVTAAAWVPTVLDRLAAGARGPRPVTLGETGSSNGEALQGNAGARLLSVHAAAVFDALPHLLSLAHGHSGVLRWAVADVPLVYAVQGMTWLGNHSDPSTTQKYAQQGRFGLTSWDGTPGGVLKPTTTGLRTVRSLLDELRDAGVLSGASPWHGYGTFTIAPSAGDAANELGWGFSYTAPGALIVGAAAVDDGFALRFNASVCAVVAVRWGVTAAQAQRRLCVTASADASADVAVAAFAPGALPARVNPVVWTHQELAAGEEACL